MRSAKCPQAPQPSGPHAPQPSVDGRAGTTMTGVPSGQMVPSRWYLSTPWPSFHKNLPTACLESPKPFFLLYLEHFTLYLHPKML